MLNLLKLPAELKEEIERMGDYSNRRLVAERMLRSKVIQAVHKENSSPWV